jgi:hypothetical protein
VATFSAVIPFYDFRHEVRPGLTGWARIKAGYAMSTEEVTQKLCYDREVRSQWQASGMSDKPLLQSGSGDLRVGRRHLPGERRRSRARVKCQAIAFGMPLALRCAMRTKETR